MILCRKNILRKAGPVLMAMLFLGTSCQTVPNEDGNVTKEPIFSFKKKEASEYKTKPLPFQKMQVPKAQTLDESPLGVELADNEALKNTQTDRELVAPVRTESNLSNAKVSEYPVGVVKGITNPDEEVSFEINLDNAQITEMVILFAAKEVLNFSYLVDPAVKGAVTVNIKTTMKAKEIWDTLQHLLWLSGAYASPSSGFINILPFDKMPKERRIFADHDVQPNVEVLFIPIRYKKSTDVTNIIKPFMTDGATATDLADSNTILIVEAPANVNKLKELIARIDNKGEREWPVSIFPLHEVLADDVASELNNLLPVLGMPVASANAPSGGAIKVTALPRLGAIVVSASLKEVVDEVGKWIKILDRSDMLDKDEIFFYNVRHSTVSSLSNALSTFFNAEVTANSSSTSSSSSSRTTSSTSSTRRNTSSSTSNTNNRNMTTTNNTSTTNRNNANNRITGTVGTNRTGTNNNNNTNVPSLQSTIFETPVTVYTDEESNRLTIKTTQRCWTMLKAFLQRQDVPPRQVSIRAIITDISLNKETEYGISYSLNKIFGHEHQNSVTGLFNSEGNITTDSSLNTIMSNVGLGLLYKNAHGDPLALIKAVAGASNTRVLSEPHVVAVSGAEAQISLGDKVAVPTESTTYSDTENMRSNYEYLDTGIIMKVTPYVTAGNDVRMVISQEVSNAVYRDVNNVNVPPTIVNKSLSSELVVPDNSTLIMGGMIKNENTDNNSGIPFLKDIPYLGVIFRNNVKKNTRSELLVLLTVNVVDSKNPQEELVRRYKASLEEIEKANNANSNY